MPTKKMTMGVIVGNRGFFPDHLAKTGREEILRVLTAAGMDVVALTPEESKYGAVETREESRRCADLFKRNRDRIDGVIVTLPNFGEERAIADTLRLADLRVPVLIVHGEADRIVPARFSQALYRAAPGPKKLLLIDGGTHNNSMRTGALQYRDALAELFGLGRAVPSRPHAHRRLGLTQ